MAQGKQKTMFAHPLFDIVFKIGTPLGLALVAWMGSKFATQAELDALEGQVNEIQKVLAVMVEQNKVNAPKNLEKS